MGWSIRVGCSREKEKGKKGIKSKSEKGEGEKEKGKHCDKDISLLISAPCLGVR